MKVRPNGIPKGADREATFKRIGQALHEVGEDATGFGVEIRVEVHGGVTCEVPNFAKIMKHADHPNVYACWNSNPTDVEDGSIQETFALVGPQGSTRSTSATSPTRTIPGASCSPCLQARKATTALPSPRSPRAPIPDRVLKYFRASGWPISLPPGPLIARSWEISGRPNPSHPEGE